MPTGHADVGGDAGAGVGSPAVMTVAVGAAIAPVHAEPRAASEQVTQSLAGHLVTVLEARDGWRRVQLADGYEGWMHDGYLDAHMESVAGARLSLGCTVRDTESGMERALPFGARVPRRANIVAGEAITEDERSRRFPAEGLSIASSATRWFAGTSYQWGGITPWGADCSGMVQAVFALHGVPLPRDARQQAELGSRLTLAHESWRAGDLLFFSDRADGRITHVALVAEPGELMHVAIGRGGFAVEHPFETPDSYAVALMGRLREARRVL